MNVKSVMMIFCEKVEIICMDGYSLFFAVDECFGDLNHEEDVFLRIKLRTWVIQVHVGRSLLYWRISGYIPNQERYFLILGHHQPSFNVAEVRLTNFNVGYVGNSGVESQEV